MKAAVQRKKRLLLLLACISGSLLLATFAWYSRIPRHQGKTVYYWRNQAVPLLNAGFQNPQWKQLGQAFDAMGPAAIPYIVEWLPDYDAGDHKVIRQAKQLLQKIGLRPVIYGRGIRPRTALVLLEFLGSKAVGASERLEELLLQPAPHSQIDTRFVYDLRRNPYDPLQVIGLMGRAASNSSPAIAQLFNSTNIGVRQLACDAFAAITPPGSAQVETLREAMRAGKIDAARGMLALSRLKAPYDEFIPALAREAVATNQRYPAFTTVNRLKLQRSVYVPYASEILQNADPTNRALFLKELARLGPHALPALSNIVLLLTNQPPIVTDAASNALRRISPSAFVQAFPAQPETP